MHHRNSLAPVVLGLTLTAAMAPAAAGGGGGHSVGAGYGLRSVNSFRAGNRLYRHRSGYLYDAGQPYAYPRYGISPYACADGGAIVPAPGPDQSCGAYLDPRQDFDCRRDRLLRAASNVDVSYLFEEPAAPDATVADGPGWAFLRDGEPAKALGRFTARLMRSPRDSASQIGYALAAALLGDDATAAAAMEDVMRSDPDAVRAFANAEIIDGVTRDLLERYAAVLDVEPADYGARLMTVALHALRDDDAAARAAIAAVRSAAPMAAAPAAAAPSPAGPNEAVAQRD